MSPSVLRVEAIPSMEHCEAEWRALAAEDGNLFATWEWASLWWERHGAGRTQRIFGFRDDGGALRAILPCFLAADRPLRVLRLIGHGGGEYAGPICAPAMRPAVTAALRRLGRDSPWAWDVLLVERLWDEAWQDVSGVVLRREDSPVLHRAGRSWPEFLAGQSRNFREQIGRYERRLAKRHDLTFRRTTDPARLDADLDLLFTLHDQRWGDDVSPGFIAERRDFHRVFARTALDAGWLRLWILELDGEAAAAWYGFRFGDAEWYYQAGRDPALADASVGFVLMAHAIRAAFEDGVGAVRLLRGDQAYKRRWATDDPGVRTVALTHGVRGAAAARALRAGIALPPVIRRPLVKRLG